MVKNLLFILFWVIGSITAFAKIDTRTDIFDPSFRTLKIELKDNFMGQPVIRLGSGECLLISFDEIGEDNRYLSARLLHCNSDWQPSALVESEYIDGFNTIDIEDYAFSTNTFIHYVNYQLMIPSEGFSPMVSGNYLVQIYDRDDPDYVLLQARFRVVEPMVGVTGGVTTRTDRGVNDKYQQLSVRINSEGFDVGNPYQDLKVEIIQNNRESTSRILTSPLRIAGEDPVYDHLPELLFPASNEYRRFESTSVLFPGMRVDSTKYMGTNYHTWLNTDYPRKEHNYEYDKTQRGRYIIKEFNATDSSIGADYITVHFFLDTPEMKGAEVYLDGEITHGNFDDRNRMVYNGARGGYELQLPLKQGAYNYQYVVKNQPDANPSTSEIEGDKYETGNEYGIFVYSRKPGERYDRLVGYEQIFN